MKTLLQTQTETFFIVSTALRSPVIEREDLAKAADLLKRTALTGKTCAVRMRAIEAMKRHGMVAPQVFGGGDAA